MAKYVVNINWDEAVHLSAEDKATLMASYSPAEREARSKGIPSVGSGAIYPVPESDFVVDTFNIPPHWVRAFGMDVGWKRTAAVWGAYNSQEDCWYLYSEHYRGYSEPSIHVNAIQSRGKWISGVIDPAARAAKRQSDGIALLDEYMDLGLDLSIANNAVEAGLLEVFQRLATGRLKVMKHLTNWLSECRIYRRDDKGRIVKKDDHLMDATRYLMMSGMDVASLAPDSDEEINGNQHGLDADVGRNSVTGY
jgi:hypothetical protein